MKIVEQSFQIISPADQFGFIQEAKLIEQAGRVAYQSNGYITEFSFDAFIRKIISRGHEAVIEFGSMAVKFITERGVTHELVRHRLCSFLQESTRYCNYTTHETANEVNYSYECDLLVIRPSTFDTWTEKAKAGWLDLITRAETAYLNLIENGLKPQQARAVLPNSLKTEIVVRANFREWRHIFRLRCAPTAHPDIRALMTPLRDECIKMLPCVFADLKGETDD
jgi:thymidylate synthase (FAD)